MFTRLINLRSTWKRAMFQRLMFWAARAHRWAYDGMTASAASAQANHGLAQVRLSICQACPHLKGPSPLERCGKCGCFMRAKAELSGAKCPIGRW